MSDLELLNREKILHAISQKNIAPIKHLELLTRVDSTNTYLLNKLSHRTLSPCAIVLAEHQTAGRGRHARTWHSPYGRNIYLSLAWRFNHPPAALMELSMTVATTVLNALTQLGADNGLHIKWPNDVMHEDKKIAGILIETQCKTPHKTDAVIGVGINLDVPHTTAIDQPWTDLKTILGHRPARNAAIGLVIDALLTEMLTIA